MYNADISRVASFVTMVNSAGSWETAYDQLQLSDQASEHLRFIRTAHIKRGFASISSYGQFRPSQTMGIPIYLLQDVYQAPCVRWACDPLEEYSDSIFPVFPSGHVLG